MCMYVCICVCVIHIQMTSRTNLVLVLLFSVTCNARMTEVVHGISMKYSVIKLHRCILLRLRNRGKMDSTLVQCDSTSWNGT